MAIVPWIRTATVRADLVSFIGRGPERRTQCLSDKGLSDNASLWPSSASGTGARSWTLTF